MARRGFDSRRTCTRTIEPARPNFLPQNDVHLGNALALHFDVISFIDHGEVWSYEESLSNCLTSLENFL